MSYLAGQFQWLVLWDLVSSLAWGGGMAGAPPCSAFPFLPTEAINCLIRAIEIYTDMVSLPLPPSEGGMGSLLTPGVLFC